MQKGCTLHLKIIVHVCRGARTSNDHLLMVTRLTEQNLNKEGFSRMNVSLIVQVLSASTYNMI